MSKQPYSTPEFEDFGSIADLTQAVGGSAFTDVKGTGSMAFMGMGPGMDVGMGMGPVRR